MIAAAALKFWLEINKSVPFNGDEAIVGLMAKHILSGERPVFFYGQAYMGSLDAWLTAGAFKIFGVSVAAIRLVQGLLYLGYLLSLWWLAALFSKHENIPVIIVALAALPPVVITTYTTASLGGYGESLILGNIVLGLGYCVIYTGAKDNYWNWAGLGLAAGVGFWTLGIAGMYIVPVGLLGLRYFDIRLVRKYLLTAGAFILGSLPWWLYNLRHSWDALAALSGPGAGSLNIKQNVFGFIFIGLPGIFGLRPPWSSEYFPWMVSGLLVLVYTGVILVYWRRRKEKSAQILNAGGKELLIVFLVVYAAVFAFSRFGVDSTGRYLLPLYTAVLFFTAGAVLTIWEKRPQAGMLLLAIVAALNLAGNLIGAGSQEKITTQFGPISRFDNSSDQALIDFLREHDVLTGYSNHWVSFRLAFLTGEEIIYAAKIPFREDMLFNPEENRIPLYEEMADKSAKPAYITSKHPVLDGRIRETLDRYGISYREKQIGVYHVFYDLSQTVRPEVFEFDLIE